jgi:hypothetical protein
MLPDKLTPDDEEFVWRYSRGLYTEMELAERFGKEKELFRRYVISARRRLSQMPRPIREFFRSLPKGPRVRPRNRDETEMLDTLLSAGLVYVSSTGYGLTKEGLVV